MAKKVEKGFTVTANIKKILQEHQQKKYFAINISQNSFASMKKLGFFVKQFS